MAKRSTRILFRSPKKNCSMGPCMCMIFTFFFIGRFCGFCHNKLSNTVFRCWNNRIEYYVKLIRNIIWITSFFIQKKNINYNWSITKMNSREKSIEWKKKHHVKNNIHSPPKPNDKWRFVRVIHIHTHKRTLTHKQNREKSIHTRHESLSIWWIYNIVFDIPNSSQVLMTTVKTALLLKYER